MHKDETEHAQWTLDVTVYHGTGFGHRLRVATLNRSGGWHTVGNWSWKGVGIPAGILNDALASVDSVIMEHMTTRYGLQNPLELRWADDRPPF